MRLCSNQLFLTMEHSTSSATQNLTLIGIYSPVARCGKTAFALAASQLLSEKNPTLFISFESCSGLSYFLSNNTAYTIGDLFYLLRHKKENPFAFLASLIQKNGPLHYLPPVCIPQDIWNLTSADCEALFSLFAMEENPYQTLVLDFGPNLSAVFPIFSESSSLSCISVTVAGFCFVAPVDFRAWINSCSLNFDIFIPLDYFFISPSKRLLLFLCFAFNSFSSIKSINALHISISES